LDHNSPSTSAKLVFYTYILYLFKFIRYKNRDHNNFMNNMSSFIPVGLKIGIKSDSVTFL